MAGAYFLLTSLYCLLAFLPYTYCAFVKAPPYPWMPRFAQHQAILYWIAVTAAVIAARIPLWRTGWKERRFLLPVGLLATLGMYLSVRPFLPGLHSNQAAYFWSLASLLPLPLIALSLWSESGPPTQCSTPNGSIGFSSG